MLTYLQVDDFALVESIEVEFRAGFNALTGETGAGKTVLVGAIGLLLGERGDSMQVRQGSKQARFACAFDLSGRDDISAALVDAGYLETGESELLLGRTLSRQGKSRCTVNGSLAPVSALAEIGDMLVDVHGQNTHQALLRTGAHLEYLDRFAGKRQLADLEEYRTHHGRLHSLARERESLLSAAAGGAREQELLAREVAEIEKVAPEPGEIERLEARALKLRGASELAELGSRVSAALAGDVSTSSAREMLVKVEGDLRRMEARDGALAQLAARVEAAAYEVEDIAAAASGYVQDLETDPAALEAVEVRLSDLRGLARRFGGSLDAVLEYRDEAKRKLEAFESSGRRAGEIDAEIARERTEVARLASVLSKVRHQAAGKLSSAVLSQMAELELSGARFDVEVKDIDRASDGAEEDGYTGTGSDAVEFLFSPGPEEPPKPLRRIASGGEMSRVMLALKIVLAGADRIPVLVFDEVDAGIGGETAAHVGEKLFQLTRHHQVFCVTHIPLIAACADWQYRVFKKKEDGGARTGIELVEGPVRVEEMCRMLGDSSGRRVTLEHARDLLARAQRSRKRVGVK
jgi:DNA repair protein RecN (Recombination protein N)